MAYQLYYWPGIQGRGEFVRLALEDAGAAYEDVARIRGVPALMEAMKNLDPAKRPFAPPPFLKDGELLIGQTANILYYLGPRLGSGARRRRRAVLGEPVAADHRRHGGRSHDTHHPVAAGLYTMTRNRRR